MSSEYFTERAEDFHQKRFIGCKNQHKLAEMFASTLSVKKKLYNCQVHLVFLSCLKYGFPPLAGLLRAAAAAGESSTDDV